ncbi:hypothetical protein DFH94DRAFT_770800 [Russula ochroleuca]|uniref:Uncharacterized protein n=1 Tax=Russula ochroleuca TaxID=152965 RepID=A0A9P5JXN9_9AGAM|nr:hypothetical protein DFH94DRAFT_770800 [Russula ochroleuca]
MFHPERLNGHVSQSHITNSPCTAILLVPSSSSLFIVSRADDIVIVYDKNHEDGVFAPRAPTTSLQLKGNHY